MHKWDNPIEDIKRVRDKALEDGCEKQGVIILSFELKEQILEDLKKEFDIVPDGQTFMGGYRYFIRDKMGGN